MVCDNVSVQIATTQQLLGFRQIEEHVKNVYYDALGHLEYSRTIRNVFLGDPFTPYSDSEEYVPSHSHA